MMLTTLRVFLGCLLLAVALLLHAQADSVRTFTVIDAETEMAVRGVLVYLPSGEHVRTNWQGCFELLTDSIDHLRLRHPKYYDRRVSRADLTQGGDTLLMLPRLGNIDEVVVYGHRKDNDTRRQAMQKEANNAALNAPVPSGISFDFGRMLDFKGRAREKRLRRVKRILDKY